MENKGYEKSNKKYDNMCHMISFTFKRYLFVLIKKIRGRIYIKVSTVNHLGRMGGPGRTGSEVGLELALLRCEEI